MLLVLSDSHDPVVGRVSDELTRRGAPFAVLNPALGAVGDELRCALGPRGSRVRAGGRAIDLDAVAQVWLWRPGLPYGREGAPAARFGDATVGAYAEADWIGVLGDALHARPRRWLPGPPATLRRADAKLGQLALATALGLAVPETLVTNDVDEALAFIDAHHGDVIMKPPSVNLTVQLAAKGMVAYTRTIKPRDLAAIDAVVHVPVMLQRKIVKQVELRVTVVGDRVFPAEIHSQVTRRTRVDWRRYDHAHTPVREHALPDEVAARCRALAHRLGLRYGAIDLVLTPDGEYVFLEINPNGQWTWIEDLTGLPITAALCDELLRPEFRAAVERDRPFWQ